MNYVLVLETMLATMDLVGRIMIDSRRFTPAELELYISKRTALRQELVKQTNALHDSREPRYEGPLVSSCGSPHDGNIEIPGPEGARSQFGLTAAEADVPEGKPVR